MMLQNCGRKIPRPMRGVPGRSMRARTTSICLALFLSACSAAPESQTHLGALDATGSANIASGASEAKIPCVRTASRRVHGSNGSLADHHWFVAPEPIRSQFVSRQHILG